MIHSDKLPYNESGEDAIDKLIRDHIPSVARARLDVEACSSEVLPPDGRRIERGETFSVWKLEPDVIASSAGRGMDLLKLAKPTGRWHHQIKSLGKIQAWARSGPIEPGASQGVLHRLSVSSLAAGVELALKKIDPYVTSDVLVRLLEVPSFQLCVLWLINETSQESQVLGIEYRPRFAKLQTDEPISSHDFLELLRKQKPVLGIRIREKPPKKKGRRTRGRGA
jgi:hypothetical protein